MIFFGSIFVFLLIGWAFSDCLAWSSAVRLETWEKDDFFVMDGDFSYYEVPLTLCLFDWAGLGRRSGDSAYYAIDSLSWAEEESTSSSEAAA